MFFLNRKNTSGLGSKKSTAGYESSDTSESKKSKTSLDFLNTLTANNKTNDDKDTISNTLQSKMIGNRNLGT